MGLISSIISDFLYAAGKDSVKKKVSQREFQKKCSDIGEMLSEFEHDSVTENYKFSEVFSQTNMELLTDELYNSAGDDLEIVFERFLSDNMGKGKVPGEEVGRYINEIKCAIIEEFKKRYPEKYQLYCINEKGKEIKEQIEQQTLEFRSGIRTSQEAISRLEQSGKEINEKLCAMSDNFLANQGKTNVFAESDFIHVDDAFLAQSYFASHEFEDQKLLYHNFVHPQAFTLKMLINGLLVRGQEFESICDSILYAVLREKATFLVADIGCGKTTLAAAVSIKAAQLGLDVYYPLSALPNISDNAERTTLLVFDKAYDLLNCIERTYQKYRRLSNVHVLIIDQTHRMNLLAEKGQDCFVEWLLHGQEVLLSRSSIEPDIRLLRNKQNKIVIPISDDYVKKIAEELIRYGIRAEGLVPDVEVNLQYAKKTITEVVSEYFVGYNEIARNNPSRQIKKHIFDWDAWDAVAGLEGTFKHVAALYSYGVPVSITCFEKMTGKSEMLVKAVEDGKIPVAIVNGFIRFRHDSVASDYFPITGYPRFNAILTVIEKDWMDEDTVIRFEKTLFSLSLVKCPPPGMDGQQMGLLLSRFAKKHEYVNILIKHQRIHSLELALLMQISTSNRNRLVKEAGLSFQRVIDMGTYDNRKLVIWIKYFLFVAREGVTVPPEMLSILSKNDNSHLYMQLTDNISRMLKRYDIGYSDDENHYMLLCAKELFKYIIEKIDNKDIPSRFALCRIYRLLKRFDDAERVVREIENLVPTEEERFRCLTCLTSIYCDKAKYLISISDEKCTEKLALVNKQIEQEYERGIDEYKNSEKHFHKYVTLVCSFARYWSDKGNFDRAFKMLDQAAKDVEQREKLDELRRVYCNLGYLCQRDKSWNKYLNYDHAIEYFKKTLALATKNYDRMTALKPLCNTYLQTGKYKETLDICFEMYQIDQHDKEIVVLCIESYRMDEIDTKKYPKWEECDHKWLAKADEKELIQAIKDLCSKMTNEQHFFIEAYWEDGIENAIARCGFSCKSLRELYCMVFCIAGNRGLPRNLRKKISISWKHRNELIRLISGWTGHVIEK